MGDLDPHPSPAADQTAGPSTHHSGQSLQCQRQDERLRSMGLRKSRNAQIHQNTHEGRSSYAMALGEVRRSDA